MSTRAKAMKNLYERGRITKSAVDQALQDGVITQEEYYEIISTPNIG